MKKITTTDEYRAGDEVNQLIGSPVLEKTTIEIHGKNNIVFCEDGTKLVNSSLAMNGDNSVIYIRGEKNPLYINVSINNNNVFYIGKNCYTNPSAKLSAICSEEKHIFIGDDGLFAQGIWIRNADPHLVYSAKDLKRINPSSSILIGDHVWIGQDALILKGTQIGSGSIIGAGCVAANKKIASNCSYAGNPARLIAEDIFWRGDCVHKWTSEQTEKSMTCSCADADAYIYSKSDDNYFDVLDKSLSWADTSAEKLKILQNIRKDKNRFARA